MKGELRDARFSVVSLGKLGGNELNYSSDVDLLFLYDGGVEPAGAAISNREYFILLAQDITELLSRRTREGQVMRIDLRLRPQGHEGELAVALPRAIQYYSEVAQDWELQAMIKARHSAGDANLAGEFIPGGCALCVPSERELRGGQNSPRKPGSELTSEADSLLPVFLRRRRST